MKLVAELAAEHELIERVAGSLLTWAAARVAGGAGAEDAPRFLRFFRLYADRFHHAREEDVLFAALHRDAELPADRGPIAVLTSDHRAFAVLLAELESLAGRDPADPDVAARLPAVARRYVHALWHHIDAENTVLFPEGEARLARSGVTDLPSRARTDEEREAEATGRDLVARHPPTSDADALRGDACVACPAYGAACRGLEHEWWTESEWDEAPDHLPSG